MTHTPPLPPTSNPTTRNPDAASSQSTGLQFSISLPEKDQPETTEEAPPFSSFLSDVRPLLSRPITSNFSPFNILLDTNMLYREYYTNHTRRTEPPRFNQHLEYSLKPEFSTWEVTFWDSRRPEYTIQSTYLVSQRWVVPHRRPSQFPADVA